jgi:ribosome biogenesis GTPase / thiamine phosphate phosphatase
LQPEPNVSEEAARRPPPGKSPVASTRGVILEALGGVYRVLTLESGQVEDAFLRGRLKLERRTGDRIVPGDHVGLGRADDGSWMVEEVSPRTSELVRAGPNGHRPKVVAANLDRVVVVVAASHPTFRRDQVDRFLALAESCALEALLVVNKADLSPDLPRLMKDLEVYSRIGYSVRLVSAESGEGLAEVATVLRSGVNALIGPSGVGKSSLLNALAPGLDLRVGAVGARFGSGRHTTVGARLLPLPGVGQVIDTPGFSDVNLWGVDPAFLPRAFREFLPLSEECRFRGCSHTHEPDCRVQDAVRSGEIDAERYGSYLALADGSGFVP